MIPIAIGSVFEKLYRYKEGKRIETKTWFENSILKYWENWNDNENFISTHYHDIGQLHFETLHHIELVIISEKVVDCEGDCCAG